jgi:hypothetical protein
MRRNRFSRIAGALLALVASAGLAQVPDRLNYQGVLKRGDGSSVGEGYQDIQFRMWDATSGGTLIWARTHRVHTDANGLFNVVLMDGGSPLAGAQTDSLAAVFTGSGGEERYLELTVVGSTPIMPRQRFVTAPYAFMADDVQQAKANFTVQGALTVQQGAQVHSLTVDDDASVGGDLTVGGTTTVGGNLSGGGYNFLNVSGEPFDVWIQGHPESTAASDTRNLALIGNTTEDKLYVNWGSEYTAGTKIGGPVQVTGGTLTADDSVSVGNDLSVGGDAAVDGTMTVEGYSFFSANSSYDVWIQGGHPGSVHHGDDRNAALVGYAEDNGDKLYVNWGSEYGGGTKIGGPVEVTSWKTKNIEANGYADMGGLYIQWGTVTSSSDGSQTFDFPTTFPSACYSVVCNRKVTDPSSPICASSWSRTGFTVNRESGIDGNNSVSYIAIGR